MELETVLCVHTLVLAVTTGPGRDLKWPRNALLGARVHPSCREEASL